MQQTVNGSPSQITTMLYPLSLHGLRGVEDQVKRHCVVEIVGISMSQAGHITLKLSSDYFLQREILFSYNNVNRNQHL